jgi:HK97 family phage portal protein
MNNPFKSFIKALTSLTFQRGLAGGAGVPFFGNNFDLWDNFWSPSRKQIDFATEVGDLRTSALLMAAYQWLASGLASARLTVVQVGADNKETEVQDHPLVQLFDQPNPYYGSEELLSGVALDWLIYATAYVLKFRNAGGGISQLWYEPCNTIRPVWPEDGSAWISGYEVNRNGYWIPIASEDVFVLRKGIDMENRMGQSPTSALLREYYTDRQAAQFAALLMKQGLVPPLVVSLGDKDRQVSTDDMKSFKDGLVRLMSGGSAGEPAVINAPATVDTLNYDYSKIGLREVRAIPEERFCSAMGISPYSLHFGTSRSASTYSNVENYLRHDYQAYVMPFQKYIAKRMAREMLPDFGPTDSLQVRWNYDDVPLMQTDKTIEWKRIADTYKARILDQKEAREAIGYKSDGRHEGIYYPVPSTTTSENEPETATELAPTAVPTFTDQSPMQAKSRLLAEHSMQDEELGAGRDWWRKRAPKVARELINAKPNGHGS